MEITEVRVRLMDVSQGRDRRLQGFASIVLDRGFVVRDLKIILGEKGRFVAMPSRKLTDRCTCGMKNYLRANFCSRCGTSLDGERALRGGDGRAKLHADIAHPINTECREQVQRAVLHVYLEAVRHRLETARAEFRNGVINTINDMTTEQLEAELFRDPDDIDEGDFTETVERG